MMTKKLLVLLTVSLLPASFAAQTRSTRPSQPASMQEIIRRFAASESQNKIARNNYTFTQNFDLRTIGMGGQVIGDYHRVSDIVYDDRGERVEKITYFPSPTLKDLQVTPEDMQDLAGVEPFALTLEDLPKYEVNYVGKERLDELNTYVFEVAPIKMVRGQRYFKGRIWVDDEDLQVVKAAGQSVPEIKEQRFPRFESYRENIDGKYWFPTYVYADDDLNFDRGSIHIRMVVRYTNYKKFSTNIRVIDGNGEAAPGQDTGQDKTAEPRSAQPQKPVLKRPPQ
jgi:hypothetical protein